MSDPKRPRPVRGDLAPRLGISVVRVCSYCGEDYADGACQGCGSTAGNVVVRTDAQERA